MSSAAALVVPAVKKHTATVIVAHGLGDSGAGWHFLGSALHRRGKLGHVKFIFPNAPSIPITVNMGTRMPGWYDITTFDDLSKDAHDEIGILRSRDYFTSLIKKETEETGISSERMVLGGFSQGGAMSLFTGTTSEFKLAGIFGLSSYLLLGPKFKDFIPKENTNKDTPVFMGHGEDDPLVQFEWGQKTAAALKNFGWDVEFKSYAGLEHSFDPSQETVDLEAFLVKVLPDIKEDSTAPIASKA